MKISLVGTNLELAPLQEALREGTQDVLLSPEAIAAAYARISRSPKSIGALRADARKNVARARRSNQTIVFDMGHASIAEHAVFNFDLEGISRLAIEAVQQSRLASYTERSQRYVLLGRDYLVPEEITGAGAATRFEAVVQALFAGYEELYDGLLARHLEGAGQAEAERKSVRRDLEIAAKEDARYLLPLATTGQLGMTINARSLEHMVRRLKGWPLAEVREVGRRLEEAALAVTPSLVRYTQPTAADLEWQELYPPCVAEPDGPAVAVAAGTADSVRLLQVTPAAERLLAGAVAAQRSACALPAPADLPAADADFVDRFYGKATAHSPAPRLFELVDLLFEVSCSACCFGQLKRHRMATMLPMPYDASLGVRVPPTVVAAGLEARFLDLAAQATALRRELAAGDAAAGEYLLTNAHVRRVLVKTNLRELYHLSRLRMDAHAQWEIRELVGAMVAAARRALPVAGRFLSGKDRFEEVRRK